MVALLLVGSTAAVSSVSNAGQVQGSAEWILQSDPVGVPEVRELTVRYKQGVNPVDAYGNPNATSHIHGVSFSFGHEYPNNVVGITMSPILTPDQAHSVAQAIELTGLVEFADVMMPLRTTSTPTSQWQTCGGVTAGEDPDACLVQQEWYLDAIGASTMWNDNVANTQHAVVAVVDSGKLDHYDIDDNLLSGYDFVARSYLVDDLDRIHHPDGFQSGGDGDGYDTNATDMGQGRDAGQCKTRVTSIIDPVTYEDAPERDSNWHGTAVASIIAAERNNTIGISGIAPKVKIVPVRVLGRCVETDDPMNLVNGMIWATGGLVDGVPVNNNPAHVVNLSIGSYYSSADACPTVYREAIAAGIARGAVFVASAGNRGNEPDKTIDKHVPSSCPGVISVGAVAPALGSAGSYSKTWYSTAGADVVAPGGDTTDDYGKGILVASNTEIRSLTNPTYSYKFGQGTSYSAPIVSALIAMARTKYRTSSDNARLTPAAIKEASKYAATLGAQCTGCGNGLLTGPNLLSVLDPNAIPTTARSITPSGGPNTTNQGQVSWSAPISNQWNPITAYVAKVYSAASGGTVVDTCTPQSLSQLSCTFDDLQENTNYFVSVTATATTSIESTRTQMTTYRRAAAPTGVTLTAGNRKATVRWSEVTDMGDFNGLNLYEAIAYTSQTGGSAVSSCYGNTECDIENLTGGTQYWIEVSLMTNQHPGGSIPSSRIAVTPTGASSNTPPTQNPPTGNSGTGNTSGGVTGGTGVGNNSPTIPTMKSTVGRTITASAALKAAKTKAVKGTKVTLSVSGKQRKVCQVVRGAVRVVGKGTCTVTITMKPAKGKSIKRTIQITA